MIRSRWGTIFQELIGVLRWAVELGRMDIATEIPMLSSPVALPHEGHLQQACHMFRSSVAV